MSGLLYHLALIMSKSSHVHYLSILPQVWRTPLMVAAREGSRDVVDELIRRGADVNAQDKVRF